MKVLIFTEGGKNIGFGHIMRCISLSQAFREKGIRTLLLVNTEKNLKGIWEGQDYRVFDWPKNKERALKLLNSSDIVIIDSYLAREDFYRQVSSRVGLAVYIDDTLRINYTRGIVLNGAIGAQALEYPKRQNVNYLLGPEFAPLRKEFWDVPVKKIRKKLQSVMLTFGGSDPANLTPKILSWFVCKYPSLEKRVVIGRGFKNAKRIMQLADRHTELICFPSALTMKKIMLEVDLAISASGQTLYELARVGVPTLAVAVSDNQLNNIKGWQAKGFVPRLGQYGNSRLLPILAKNVNRLMSYQKRRKISALGRRFIDGQGARRIAREILKRAKVNDGLLLRPVEKNDCYDLWLWRNHPAVRSWAFQIREINYCDHRVWFKRKLKDKQSRIYIAQDSKRRKIGQIRFDINNDLAYANINLNPKFFGKGFGSKIIKRGTELILEEPEVKEARAEILEGNIASCRAFQKSGYRFLHFAKIGEEPILVYGFRRR